MGGQEVFDALGGGIAGLLGIALIAVWSLYMLSNRSRLTEKDNQIEKLEGRILDLEVELKTERRDSRETLNAQTTAMNRLTDVVLSWTPSAQQRRAGRS